ncbi:haloacetate dehalogenase [Leifsonia sp. 98AMF]|uniref:alpha/beta fold hydrolase n=1 Tax=unclassified Leifsonia TaxID=2663824 RepID=UPI00087BA9AD|nr:MULTISPECIES: alpha/beta hydrolase [unclassified Leifsonia]SDH73831.1 haloacetate dehalogenase [Leifsonia sp. 197AMF]SDJ48201.1 haloacetate dehalogenase [Leifsonia sp. 466MF]SDK26971.1 haloacetate dehalogenase [Leifsonia sp. 157MF]SDN67989.1 haloacetate dehalogenase [Leifsonia sp. 509MF]SEN40314.1 haloacetate dehalogenase [Leifsonia sp. 467MF]
MFDGFEIADVDVGEARIHVRIGGDGPPIVLLHGHPRTGSTWHRVAPLLVEHGRTVVVPDLRGYGRSTAPPPRADHMQASKRAMADDVRELMRRLGHDRFDVVGHDRGSYAAFRLAMDHPEAVRRVALIDCLPIVEHLDRITPEFATQWYHWFFFAQPDTPERVITADPDAWYHGDPEAMGLENFAERREAVHRPEVVRAMLEDYRAGLTVDRADEEDDRAAGRQLTMPLLVLWSLRDDLEQLLGDPLAIWDAWATDVRGHGIVSGHHVAEEAPAELVDALVGFFDEHEDGSAAP